ncbi:MIF4G-domain-containing protein [Rhizodiscina lignyota]|uniref:Pre-mRNA-splicing factor CWC22 n=1 Tax=Rhizodiscina lignyota TaxID=1504668 RepID=A0A9P4M7A3_9PEZI|nr:MIF4G-domain-containing protein [Rhizodiscina lignyota]
MAEVLQSAVRVPTPDPDLPEQHELAFHPPAKRRRVSESPEPLRRPPPPSPPRQREPLTEEEKKAAAKAEYDRLLTSRSGGTYIPPARLRALQAQFTDPATKEFQRMAWEALKKSINGLINKINVSNIKHIIPELFSENLIRGRGLFCRSIMKAQSSSLVFTPIYAAMVAIVNTKLPQVGELLVHRLVVQFKKALRRNDKSVCMASTQFIAHLCNQQVVHEMLAAQILLTLLKNPTDDSVEVAVGLTREVGQHLEEMNSKIAMVLFDQFRSILHEASIDKRTQYMIEVLFQIRRDKFKDNPAVKEELDLVEEDDQITHNIALDDDDLDVQDGLNIFKFDPDYQQHEDEYKKVKMEILGDASDDEDGSEDDSDESDGEDEKDHVMEIHDQTNTDLVNLRRKIYLTIKSSGGFEEAVHKLMKIDLPRGEEKELVSMLVECASQEKTYDKFYGLIGERFCKINRMWKELFEDAFAEYYSTIHRYETNRLRIISAFFGHLLATDALGWYVLSNIHLNEEETTSSSRIFIRILFESMLYEIGMKKLVERMHDPLMKEAYAGLFPSPDEDPRATRFAINYFTAIKLGPLTDDMRAALKAMG